MDGSMGNELLTRRSDLVSGLWSAQYLIDAPELVKEVHLEYLNSGADLIITNTYSTIPSYLSKKNAEDKMPELIRLAGKLAREAVKDSKKKVMVAGSLPPLEESYRPDLVIEAAEAVPIYETLIKELTPYVDIFICETMSSIEEMQHAMQALKNLDNEKPVWISWSLKEDKKNQLRSGETIEDALNASAEIKPEAYLFNCTDPYAITEGIKELKKLTQKPIGGYPNVFNVPEGWTLDNDVQVSVRDLSIAKFLEFAIEWRNLGATIIGGCCGIGPKFIKAAADIK
ncbi:MAG: homocysteine S-methyltransferase family protein [Gammaproteobacteria bacterium]